MVEDVAMRNRGAPERCMLGLATGKLTGTSYSLAVGVFFSNRRVDDYSAVLFQADSVDRVAGTSMSIRPAGSSSRSGR